VDGGRHGVALSETFDLLDITLPEIASGEAHHFDSIEIVIGDCVSGDSEAVEHDRPEPKLADAPFFVEFDEPALLDPERNGLIWELPAASLRTIRLSSPAASLVFHLLPLLGLIIWPLMMIEPPAPIPVHLVFEEPPPPPPSQPQQQPKPTQLEPPPRGPLSSVDQGTIKQLDLGRSADPVPLPSAGETQQNPTETQTAAAAAPPLPQPKPTPPREDQATVHPPKPSGAPVARHDETPHDAPHSARYAGTPTTRDEYLAYLVTLTRQHMDLLPLSVVGDRRGETVISVVVYDNGTIGPIGVIRGSGYSDIDHRIEQMVAAVHKFPPLPQWYQGNAVQLELTLKFPEALERTP
jgi:hypothetical protein